jgi:hypothetical protein
MADGAGTVTAILREIHDWLAAILYMLGIIYVASAMWMALGATFAVLMLFAAWLLGL